MILLAAVLCGLAICSGSPVHSAALTAAAAGRVAPGVKVVSDASAYRGSAEQQHPLPSVPPACEHWAVQIVRDAAAAARAARTRRAHIRGQRLLQRLLVPRLADRREFLRGSIAAGDAGLRLALDIAAASAPHARALQTGDDGDPGVEDWFDGVADFTVLGGPPAAPPLPLPQPAGRRALSSALLVGGTSPALSPAAMAGVMGGSHSVTVTLLSPGGAVLGDFPLATTHGLLHSLSSATGVPVSGFLLDGVFVSDFLHTPGRCSSEDERVDLQANASRSAPPPLIDAPPAGHTRAPRLSCAYGHSRVLVSSVDELRAWAASDFAAGVTARRRAEAGDLNDGGGAAGPSLPLSKHHGRGRSAVLQRGVGGGGGGSSMRNGSSSHVLAATSSSHPATSSSGGPGAQRGHPHGSEHSGGDATGPRTLASGPSLPSFISTGTNRSVLMVRVDWDGGDGTSMLDGPTTLATADFLASFWAAASYGAMTVVFANASACYYAMPWVTAGNATPNGMLAATLAALPTHPSPACRFNASDFNHVWLLHPYSASLSYAGLAVVPGEGGGRGTVRAKKKRAWRRLFPLSVVSYITRLDSACPLAFSLFPSSGQYAWFNGPDYSQGWTIAHEAAHNFGLPHGWVVETPRETRRRGRALTRLVTACN